MICDLPVAACAAADEDDTIVIPREEEEEVASDMAIAAGRYKGKGTAGVLAAMEAAAVALTLLGKEYDGDDSGDGDLLARKMCWCGMNAQEERQVSDDKQHFKREETQREKGHLADDDRDDDDEDDGFSSSSDRNRFAWFCVGEPPWMLFRCGSLLLPVSHNKLEERCW